MGMQANGEIRADPVAVVDEAGVRRVMRLADALAEARAQYLDLVMVAPGADPPACRIMDLRAFADAARQGAARSRRRRD
jgi:translation initiation factor IF-3